MYFCCFWVRFYPLMKLAFRQGKAHLWAGIFSHQFGRHYRFRDRPCYNRFCHCAILGRGTQCICPQYVFHLLSEDEVSLVPPLSLPWRRLAKRRHLYNYHCPLAENTVLTPQINTFCLALSKTKGSSIHEPGTTA